MWTGQIPSQTRDGLLPETKPNAPSDQTRRRLSAQRQRDTKPELLIRRRLHAAGFRYRVNYRLPGIQRTADIAFTRARVAVFVDGCFWHKCPLHGSVPKNNKDWWIAKLNANVDRDRHTDALLQQLGWKVVRIWEHEDPDQAVKRIVRGISASRCSTVLPTGNKPL